MTYGTGIKHTAEQKAEMWDRSQKGKSLHSIGRAFDRSSFSIFGQFNWHLAVEFVLLFVRHQG